MSVDAEDSAYALLTDGATIEIRAVRPEDFDAVRDMHAKMSPDNLYLRFFSMSPAAAEQEARRICRQPGPDHAALLALLDGEVAGCGTYEQAGAGSRSAEVAMAVADDLHNRGIGMLLLEHLVSLARGREFRAFTAETLSENAAMLRVFADAGLQAQRSLADGVYDLTFPLPGDEADAALGTYRDTVAVRERSADVASMRAGAGPGLGRGHRRQPAPRVGRPGHPAEPHHRRLPGPGLPGQPGRGRAERHPLPAVGGRAARPGRPGGHCGAGGGGARCRRGLRAAGCQGAGGDRGRTQRPGPRGAAGDLPPIRHADGRAGQLRRGQPGHRPGRHVRGPLSRGGNSRPGPAVHRRHRLRAGGAPVPAGRGDLHPGLVRRQGRRVRHRHAAVVGVRRGDEAGVAVPGIDREPAQVRPHRPPRGPRHAGPDRGRGPVRDGQAAGRGPLREGGYPAGHPAGPVRAGRHNRRRQPRRAARRRGAAGLPAGARRRQGRRGVQHPRRRGARRRRVRRRGPAGRRAGRGHPAGAAGHTSPRGRSGRTGRHHRAGRHPAASAGAWSSSAPTRASTRCWR